MSTKAQKDALAEFQAITGASDKEARKWLEKSRWNSEEAISRYFDAGASADIDQESFADSQAKQARIEKKQRLLSRVNDKVKEQIELDELVNPSVGLKVSGGPNAELLPLRGARINASIRDIIANITLQLRFLNDKPSPVEAVFCLAVEQGAIYHFEALTSDGKRVIAECKEKDEAFNTYDDAIASGHGAFLVEKTKEQRDAFAVTLGNMLPNRECIITVKYTTLLEDEGESLRLTLPVTRTNLAGTTRVIDLEEDDDDLVAEVLKEAVENLGAGAGASPAGKKSSKKEDNTSTLLEFAEKVPDGLNVDIDVEMSSRGVKIASIECPSHSDKMNAEIAKSKATVKFVNAQVARLMELLVHLENPTASMCTVESLEAPKGASSSSAADKNKAPLAAVVSFCPKMETLQEPQVETIFLVDRSGSMAGSFMNQAKNALQLFLRSLPLGTKFNIVSFGSTYSALFPSSKAYSEETMLQAERHVDEMQANMVGTDLLRPLQFVLTQEVDVRCPRQIFLLTDGSVENTSDVLSLVRRTIGDYQRIFTLGVGSDAGRSLVSGIAKFGRGKAEFVRSGTRLEAPVMRHIKRALQPMLTDVEVHWGSSDTAQSFKQVLLNADPFFPPLFDGERVTLSTFFESDVVGESDATVPITVTGRMRDEKFSFTVDLNMKWLKPGSSAHRIAAVDAIRLLQRNKGHEQHKAEIIELAKRYGLASKFTSLVAVEERDGVSASSEMIKVDVNAKQSGETGRVRSLIAEDNDEIVLAPPAPQDRREMQQMNLMASGLADVSGEERLSESPALFQSKSKRTGGGISSFLGGVASAFGKLMPGGSKSASAKTGPSPGPMHVFPAEAAAGGSASLARAEYIDDEDSASAFDSSSVEEEKEEEEAKPIGRKQTLSSPKAMDMDAKKKEGKKEKKVMEREASPRKNFAVEAGEMSRYRSVASEDKFFAQQEAVPSRPAGPAAPPPPPAAYSYSVPAAPAAAPVSMASGPRAPIPSSSALRPLDRFVRMIRAAGNFELADVASCASVPESNLRSAAPKEISQLADFGGNCTVWATALAIVLFDIQFADSKVEWETVATKAQRWLLRVIGEQKLSISLDQLLDAARAVLSKHSK